MTARPPIPACPQPGVRAAYRVQRPLPLNAVPPNAVPPNAVLRPLGARIEAPGLARRLITKAEPQAPQAKQAKQAESGCRMCGQRALPVTGYVCRKELPNGQCGGVGADGGCEVRPDRRRDRVEAYERAASQGRPAGKPHRPAGNRRRDTSSWLSHRQGRDEDLRPTAGNGSGRS